ncbi:hypothetical protein PVK06_045879 [Gossypium arboreum]|uniref:Uncharacterized protein n=1 Tax=Gossypium arboreum TaxID=29729 RepID=A0ABR0MV94_GOSAR|nr:hypothetical protein PVK06_045879 [Gossypium arboreum]
MYRARYFLFNRTSEKVDVQLECPTGGHMKVEAIWNVLFDVDYWRLWKNKNLQLLQGVNLYAKAIVRNCISWTGSLQQVAMWRWSLIGHGMMLVQWRVPLQGWMIVNVDCTVHVVHD